MLIITTREAQKCFVYIGSRKVEIADKKKRFIIEMQKDDPSGSRTYHELILGKETCLNLIKYMQDFINTCNEEN